MEIISQQIVRYKDLYVIQLSLVLSVFLLLFIFFAYHAVRSRSCTKKQAFLGIIGGMTFVAITVSIAFLLKWQDDYISIRCKPTTITAKELFEKYSVIQENDDGTLSLKQEIDIKQ